MPKLNRVAIKQHRTRELPPGFKVRFEHILKPKLDSKNKAYTSLQTIANVYDTDRELVASECSFSSVRDTPDRKVGNHIALQRALKHLEKHNGSQKAS